MSIIYFHILPTRTNSPADRLSSAQTHTVATCLQVTGGGSIHLKSPDISNISSETAIYGEDTWAYLGSVLIQYHPKKSNRQCWMTHWTVGEVEINKIRDSAAFSVNLASNFMLRSAVIYFFKSRLLTETSVFTIGLSTNKPLCHRITFIDKYIRNTHKHLISDWPMLKS